MTIVGAGAVGLVLGGRLAAAGIPVRFVVRRREAARAIREHGVLIEDPATGERALARAEADCEPTGATPTSLLFCVRAQQTGAVAGELAAIAPGASAASAQNDVDNEATLARHFGEVVGVVVRQTCTRQGDRHVLATGRGRLIVGRHPRGQDGEARAWADRFRAAGFDTGVSSAIAEDKWLKLCANLSSAVNALVRRPDHADPAFVELKIRLLREAKAALDAAGIVARSCDGRDRSIEQEIEALEGAIAAGTSARALPLYNACWAALRDPARPLEADAYHRRILDLAAEHGLAAPTHAAVLEAVVDAYATGRGPERLGASELLERARAAESSA